MVKKICNDNDEKLILIKNKPKGRPPKDKIWNYKKGRWDLNLNKITYKCIKKEIVNFLNKSLNLNGKWGLRYINNYVVYESGFLDRNNYYTIYHKRVLNYSKLFVKNYESSNFKKLNIKLKPYKPESGKYILICGQIYTDAVLKIFKNISYKDWLLNKINFFLKKKYYVVFRKHPNEPEEILINSPFFKVSKKEKLEDDMKNAIVTIAYCSTCLIDSIIMGVPIIGYSKLSLVSDFFSNQTSFLKSGKLFFPTENERYKKMCFLANNQFLRSQLPSDEFLSNLYKSIKKG